MVKRSITKLPSIKDYKDRQAELKKNQQEIKASYEECFKLYSDNKNILGYLAGSLLNQDDTRFQFYDLAMKLAKESINKKEKTDYDYYLYWVMAELYAKKEKWNEGLKYLLKITDSLPKDRPDIANDLKADIKKYQDKANFECRNFSSCLKSAFKSLF